MHNLISWETNSTIPRSRLICTITLTKSSNMNFSNSSDTLDAFIDIDLSENESRLVGNYISLNTNQEQLESKQKWQ